MLVDAQIEVHFDGLNFGQDANTTVSSFFLAEVEILEVALGKLAAHVFLDEIVLRDFKLVQTNYVELFGVDVISGGLVLCACSNSVNIPTGYSNGVVGELTVSQLDLKFGEFGLCLFAVFINNYELLLFFWLLLLQIFWLLLFWRLGLLIN